MVNYISSDGMEIVREKGVIDQIKSNFWKEKQISESGVHAFSLLLTCTPSSHRMKEIEKNKSQFLKFLEEHSQILIQKRNKVKILYTNLLNI